MMTSAQVVETSVTTTDNSPSQDYTHPDYQTTLLHVTPGFKPFTVRQLKAIPWDTLATERSISRDWAATVNYHDQIINQLTQLKKSL